MKVLILSLIACAAALTARDPLEKRIAHVAPNTYRAGKAVHKGAGELHYGTLIPGEAFSTNFIFVHRGQLPPKGGIGHHFHNHMEEMFVILDNEAQFTMNGRTSRLAGPAVAPCRMGSSHAIYNHTERSTQWMNIAVGSRKGKYDAFDLGDDRVGAPLDATPVFVSARFDKALLRPMENLHGGKGSVRYRRALPPEVFYTNWSYVDHIVIPPGASMGKKKHAGVEELYYVIDGAGTVQVNEETAPFRKDQGLAVLLNDVHSLENNGSVDLELMVIGVAVEKWVLDTVNVK